MLGAVYGDVVGSCYEFVQFHKKRFPLFGKDCRFTDDTVMSFAIAKVVLEFPSRGDFYQLCNYYMRDFGKRYPNRGYGTKFQQWIADEDMGPYGSEGNGSAMRVCPVAYGFSRLDEVEFFAEMSARTTHNSKSAIFAAKAVAGSVFLARKGHTKEEIQQYVQQRYGYSLTKSLRSLKHSIDHTYRAEDTVPVGIICFLQSKSLEDALRNAVSIGGDTDTVAAVAGSIAEAHYTMTKEERDKVLSYLPEEFQQIYKEFYHAYLDI